MLKHLAIFVPVLVMAACGATTPPDDSDDDITGDLTDGGKTDSPSGTALEVGGTIEIGGATRHFAYTGATKYAAFKFTGNPETILDYTVSSPDRVVKGWLLDSKFKVIHTGDTGTAVTLPRNDTFYIAFRTSREAAGDVDVKLVNDPAYFCTGDGAPEQCAAPNLCTPVDPSEQEFGCQAPGEFTLCTTGDDCVSDPHGEICAAVLDPDGTVSTTTFVCTSRG